MTSRELHSQGGGRSHGGRLPGDRLLPRWRHCKTGAACADHGKLVWVIDVFDPGFDHTANTNGDRMADLYHGYLQRSSQEKSSAQSREPWADRIRVIRPTQERTSLPEGTRLAFAFGDGNHDPIWVRNDFQLIWSHLAPGGWAGFHDYGGDLPEVTAALNSMMHDHASEIERVETMKERWVLLFKKRSSSIDLTAKDSAQ